MRSARTRAVSCLLAAGLAACSDPVIEMTLTLPSASETASFDLSCVGAVKINLFGNKRDDVQNPDMFSTCFDFPTPIQSFADVAEALRGRFTFDLPRGGLAGVQLTGFSDRCGNATMPYESVFYGGAPGGDDHSLVIPLRPGVSCDGARSYNARTIELTSMYAALLSGANPCVQPSDSLRLFAGVVRPRMFGTRAPDTVFEYGAGATETGNGIGKVQSFRPRPGDPACVALGYRGASSGGLTCIRPPAQARGVCSEPDEVEIVAAPINPIAISLDPTLLASYAGPLVGAVWESGTRRPIMGATVVLADPAQGKVVYVDLGIEAGAAPPRLKNLTPIAGATSTDVGGGFTVYLRGVATDLIVTAPNHMTQTLRIASAPDMLSTVIVALERQ